MGLSIRRFTGELIIGGIDPFSLFHTLECGQAFRWERCGDGYMGVVRGRVLVLRQTPEGLGILGDATQEVIDLVVDYFDLERDYASIEAVLRDTDAFLAQAVEFGSGLRILRQEPWECLISFIISAHNRIPFIKRAVEALSFRFGERIGSATDVGACRYADFPPSLWAVRANGRGRVGEAVDADSAEHCSRGPGFFSFPGPLLLASASLEDLAGCYVGFRAPYIREAAMKVASGELDLESLRKLDTPSARSRLMQLRGVGDKVADCVLLFSLGKTDVFPMDIWIARVMHDVYLKGEAISKSRFLQAVREFAAGKFGPLQGYAQEYLYHYARNLKPDGVKSS